MRREHAEYATDDKDFVVNFFNMPVQQCIRDLRTDKIAKLISFQGTVTRTSEVRPELLVAVFQCELCGAYLEGFAHAEVLAHEAGCRRLALRVAAELSAEAATGGGGGGCVGGVGASTALFQTPSTGTGKGGGGGGGSDRARNTASSLSLYRRDSSSWPRTCASCASASSRSSRNRSTSRATRGARGEGAGARGGGAAAGGARRWFFSALTSPSRGKFTGRPCSRALAS